jgi:protoporphyrin/coproporphyrin ferrochelatase
MTYCPFTSKKNYVHGERERIGVLMTNVGSPEAPTAKALRPYLREFLSDPRVIEVPKLLWFFLLNLIIVPFRSPKSAAAYKKVWTKDGSPLVSISREQRNALEKKLHDAGLQEDIIVEIGMGYGNPSIASGLQALRQKGATKLFVLPMFPQYSGPTTASTFDGVTKELQKWRWLPDFRFLTNFVDRKGYIDALANSITEHWQKNKRGKLLLFSFHGVPKRYLLQGDPYHCQCRKTARLVAEKLGLSKEEYMVSFQSRFGREPWLEPYTIEMMEWLPKNGIDSIDVVCPAFSADCLETIEEISGENCEEFHHAGGKEFQYIPALNVRDDFIEVLFQIVLEETERWRMNLQRQENKETHDEYLKVSNADVCSVRQKN